MYVSSAYLCIWFPSPSSCFSTSMINVCGLWCVKATKPGVSLVLLGLVFEVSSIVYIFGFLLCFILGVTGYGFVLSVYSKVIEC